MSANTASLKRSSTDKRQGFTLIELSIVLVIIGLIVGGVLVGQDLIRAAEVRATIAQIEKYNTAVNTFRGKFNAIPGDMNSATASAFGFTTVGVRSSTGGQGDGNGVIDGGCGSDTAAHQLCQGYGETSLFWEDLSSSVGGNLIDGSFSTGSMSVVPVAVTTTTMPQYLPAAKLGRGNFIYVFENNDGTNYYGVSAASAISVAGVMTSAPTMSVSQAYNIDKKVDDGAPTTGNVIARYVTTSAVTPTVHAASPAAATDCYDSTATPAYGLATNNGAGANCALTFKFQ